jgi:hypothetical protein
LPKDCFVHRAGLARFDQFDLCLWTRTRAGGVRQDTSGSVVSFVHMGADGFEFGDEHSAEWVYSIQATYSFWKEILTKFALNVTN